ncbi:MAG: AI-2E family transporter [Dehalococcoidia bacterium]
MSKQRWRIALWGVMLLAVLWIMWTARIALLPFLIGALAAYALSPLVDRLASLVPARTHQHDKIRRGAVVLLLYVLFFGSLTGVGAAVVPTAVNQATNFIDDLPEITEEARIQLTSWVDRYRSQIPDELREEMDRVTQDLGSAAADLTLTLLGGTIGSLSGTIGLVFGFLVVPFWLFYALRDRPFVQRNFMRAVPDAARDDVGNVAKISDALLGRYIRAQLLLGVIVGLAIGISMTLLGVQFSVGLGLWAGITELIPILGPWLGAAAGILVVLATDPELLVWVALIYFVVQQLENNLLVPRIQGDAVDIHPAMVIMLLVIVGSIWGFPGMLVAVPVLGIARELFWYADRRLRGETPIEAYSASHVGRRKRAELPPVDGALEAPERAAIDEAGALAGSGPHSPAEVDPDR